MEYGLLGAKLGHSHSPRIHRAFAGYDYVLREISEEELPDFLTERNFKGLNVTIPYKQTVIPFCDELGEGAKRIGSVNALVVRPDGSLFGDNTDYYGFCYTTRRSGIDFAGKHVLVLGSGGTSLTARRAAEDLGAASVRRVSRSGEVNYDNVYDLTETEIIINTTPVGMYPHTGKAAVDLGRFPNLKGVADVVYNPLRTAFLLQAEELGIPAAGGLPMLVAQAKRACELFTGTAISDEKLEEVVSAITADVTNLVLIGMPGSGKSTVGKLLADKLGREFLDADEEIARAAGMTIPEIFEQYGQEHFRALETQVLAELGKRSGVVLSTGGGCVLFERNYAPLHQNGWICRLRRPVEQLSTEGRPLSTSLERLKEMEGEREGYYCRFADKTVDNTGAAEETAAAILKDFLG